MGIFRRSLSSSSSVSSRSTGESLSDTISPRTSIESHHEEEISSSLITVKRIPKQDQVAPLLKLPIELIQSISKYLDSASAASFCLSTRYIYYALGTATLSKYVESSKSRFEKRRTIEAVVERAFPGHFFCAWCDRFHSWSPQDGPTTSAYEKKRNCAEYNSFLCSESYKLCYHHVRLAINHSLWGPAHGIPLSFFAHTSSSMARVLKAPVPTKLSITARICPETQHFLLHTSMAIIMPSWCTSNKSLLKQIWPILPHILSGHRATDNGHTGLMAAVDNVVRRGWKYPFTQACSLCKSDWSVASHNYSHSTGSQTRLVIQTWRDLGDGRNPFETGWRAHGVFMQVKDVYSTTTATSDAIRLAVDSAGDVKRRFELAEQTLLINRQLQQRRQQQQQEEEEDYRSRSLSRNRIYRSFMRRSEHTEESEVRRSRTRPRRHDRTWDANEELERGEHEESMSLSRRVALELVRLDAERRRYG